MEQVKIVYKKMSTEGPSGRRPGQIQQQFSFNWTTQKATRYKI